MVLANAISASTAAYLGLLDKSTPDEKWQVRELYPDSDNEDFVIAGERMLRYTSQLPCGECIWPGERASLTPQGDGVGPLDVLVVAYDRKSGYAQLALPQECASQQGTLSVDFKWLVKRCGDWFRNCGHLVAHPEQIPAPEVDWASLRDGLRSPQGTEPSGEQWEAIQAVVCDRLPYVWGPPGTGKTQIVLATAVSAFVQLGRRVLLLASTNMAVDNALFALLGRPKSLAKYPLPSALVARIGIPSVEFLNEHPQCCEQRAFEFEIAQLRSQLRILGDEQARLNDLRSALGRLPQLEEQHTRTVEAAARLKKRCVELAKSRSESQARVDGARVHSEAIASQLDKLWRERDSLLVPELREKVQILEDEQALTLIRLAEHRKDLGGMGSFSQLLLRAKYRRHQEGLAEGQEHLEQVEQTLSAMRERLSAVEPRYRGMCDQVATAEKALEEARLSREKESDSLQRLGLREDAAREKLRVEEEQVQRLQEEIARFRDRMQRSSRDGAMASAEAIALRVASIARQIQLISAKITKHEIDLASKQVIAMTLDTFIGSSLSRGALRVDQVVIDEAPYACLAKVVPLLALKCPIAMLGDHKQLPPVCRVDKDQGIAAFWAKPATFLEDAFRLQGQVGRLWAAKAPLRSVGAMHSLTHSYRFGGLLPSLLDSHVYDRMGLHGQGDTGIRVIDCPPVLKFKGKKRQNVAEADMAVQLVGQFLQYFDGRDLPSLAILAPYKNQCDLIRDRLRRAHLLDKVDVLNTHRAQGREWDWVLFSVVDTETLGPRYRPFFVNALKEPGRSIINTTISRGREEIRLLLDLQYWRQKTPACLIGDIARASR